MNGLGHHRWIDMSARCRQRVKDKKSEPEERKTAECVRGSKRWQRDVRGSQKARWRSGTSFLFFSSLEYFSFFSCSAVQLFRAQE